MEPLELEPILGAIDMTIEAGLEAVSHLHARNIQPATEIFGSIREFGSALNDRLYQDKSRIYSHSNSLIISENIVYSTEKLVKHLAAGDARNAAQRLQFETISLLRDLREDLYFYHVILPDKTKFQKYYKSEFSHNHRNIYSNLDSFPYEVSVVVVAFNKLDYTKACIESILQHTDFTKLKCEFITIDNGSTDGTNEYFHSLTHEKKIHFKVNSVRSLNLCIESAAEGRFLAFVSNDVIVTHNWLENLLACIRSDSRIAMVVPTTVNVSNLQTIPVSYESLIEMHEFARRHNVSDPAKWEERARLCPPVSLIRMSAVNELGCVDRYFHFGEFGDDDFSLRCRRGGYKQILCKDTFVHHFGSVTTGEAQKKQDSLRVSRKLFIEKHGVDPWDHDYCYDGNAVTAFNIESKDGVNILGIDSCYGSTPLQIKNLLRERGNHGTTVYNFTCDSRFIDDLKSVMSDHFCYNENIYAVQCAFEAIGFDYIYVAPKAERYEDIVHLMKILYKRLKIGGKLLCKVSNPYHITNILGMVQHALPFTGGSVRWYDMEYLVKAMEPVVHGMEITAETATLNEPLKKYAGLVCNLHGQKDVERYMKTVSRTADILVIRK